MSYTRFDDINVMSNYYASLNSEIKQFDGQNFYAYHSNKLSYNHIALSKYNEYVLYVGDIYKDSVANINDKIVLYFEVGKSDKNVVKKFKENIDANFKINWSFVIYFSLGLGIIFILIFVGFWKLFVKMGFLGWKSLIPIYNIACLSEATIGKKKYAWLLLIPYVNIIFILILFYNIAKVFGKGFGSQLFTVLLPSFMIPLIAFDESKYVKPVDINKEKESSSVKKVEDTEIKKQSLLSKIICWIITIFMLFISFFEFLIAFEDKEFIIYTLFTLIFAIMACPPISAYTRKFKKYTKYKKAIVIILVILLFILFATL